LIKSFDELTKHQSISVKKNFKSKGWMQESLTWCSIHFETVARLTDNQLVADHEVLHTDDNTDLVQ